jgi:acetyl esterase/lipase
MKERDVSEKAEIPVVYRVRGMDDVQVKTDIRYTDVDLSHLLMDFYLPPHLPAGELKPAVLFLHGNVPPGSPAKNMGVFKSWGRRIAASGMVGVAFTHRLGYPETCLAEAAADVAAAIEYIRDESDSLRIDRDRICLMVFSGGELRDARQAFLCPLLCRVLRFSGSSGLGNVCAV